MAGFITVVQVWFTPLVHLSKVGRNHVWGLGILAAIVQDVSVWCCYPEAAHHHLVAAFLLDPPKSILWCFSSMSPVTTTQVTLMRTAILVHCPHSITWVNASLWSELSSKIPLAKKYENVGSRRQRARCLCCLRLLEHVSGFCMFFPGSPDSFPLKYSILCLWHLLDVPGQQNLLCVLTSHPCPCVCVCEICVCLYTLSV